MQKSKLLSELRMQRAWCLVFLDLSQFAAADNSQLLHYSTSLRYLCRWWMQLLKNAVPAGKQWCNQLLCDVIRGASQCLSITYSLFWILDSGYYHPGLVLIQSHTVMMLLSDWSPFYPVKNTPLLNNTTARQLFKQGRPGIWVGQMIVVELVC